MYIKSKTKVRKFFAFRNRHLRLVLILVDLISGTHLFYCHSCVLAFYKQLCLPKFKTFTQRRFYDIILVLIDVILNTCYGNVQVFYVTNIYDGNKT